MPELRKTDGLIEIRPRVWRIVDCPDCGRGMRLIFGEYRCSCGQLDEMVQRVLGGKS